MRYAPAAINDPFDEFAIREIVAAQAASWNRQDAVSWSAAFDEDAELIDVCGRLVRGKSDIETFYAVAFASIYRASHVTVTIRKTAFPGRDVAVVDCDYALRGYDALPAGIFPSDGDGTLRTRVRYLLQRNGPAWLIISAQHTAIAPAAHRS